MGRTFRFECSKCGYRAAVAGGFQQGQQVAVQTIVCLDCRELVDAVTEIKLPARAAKTLSHWKLKPDADAERAPSLAAALNRLKVAQGGPSRWLQFKPACPASVRHRIRIWKQPVKCPKCSHFLDGGGTPFKLWD